MSTILVYDERLGGSPPWKEVSATCLVNENHQMVDIVSWLRKKCGKYKGQETVYIMAHGASGSIQLGKEGLHADNAHLWEPLRWALHQIIVLACSTGGGNNGYWFCSKLARTTRSYVTAAESTQIYFYLPLGLLSTTFGEWEGTINTWDPGGTWVARYTEPPADYSHITI